MGSPRTTPWVVTLALAAVRAVAWIVPKRDRTSWLHEWESEITHEHLNLDYARQLTWSRQMMLFRRALGSILDAAWLRRQFTRDNEWTQDVRHAWRQLRSRPRMFGAAALMLGLGVGTTAAGVSLIDRLVWRALPFERPAELVSLWQHNRATGNDREEVSPGNFLDWQESATSFAALAGAEPFSVDYTSGDRPETVHASLVTTDFFAALRVRPAHGRLLEPGDFVPGASPVVVISHAFWQRLGADPTLPGRTVRLDDDVYTVAGVLPVGADLKLLDGLGERDVWLPKVFQPYERERRGEGWWAAIARLKPGVTRAAAQAEMNTITTRLSAAYPRTNAQTSVVVVSLETVITRSIRPALTLLLASAVLVLLIACANVANLLLVRGAERQHEFAVRGALGATPARLVRQGLVEAGLLASMATVVGGVVAWLTVRVVVTLSPTSSRLLDTLTLDGQSLGVVAVVGVSTILLFGLVPAWQCATRGPAALGAESRWATGGRGAKLVRHGLVAAEVAVAVVLATGAGLLIRSFLLASGVDPGFDNRQVGVVQLFAYDRQNTPDKLRTFHAEVVDRLNRIPGVSEAGSVSALPLISANINIESPLVIEGRPEAAAGETPTGFLTVASPGYFSAMGLRLTSGRVITPLDDERGVPVVVIARSLADRHWPGGDAIGAWVSFRFQGPPQRRQIVGIVDPVRHDALELPPRDEVFIPFRQAPFASITFVFKTAGEPAAQLAAAHAAVWAVDPQQTIYEDGTVSGLLSSALAPRRFALWLSSAFALVALLLAAGGIYATMSFSIGQQIREFGVRIALGASTAQVGRAVLAQGLWPCAVGICVGLFLAIAGSYAIRTHLFAVSPFDVMTLLSVATGAVAVAVAACLGPARRAMRTDPVISLRES